MSRRDQENLGHITGVIESHDGDGEQEEQESKREEEEEGVDA